MKKYSIIDDFFEDNPHRDEQQFINKNLDITEQIYTYLAQKGWSQKELASKMGKKSAEVSKWLSGTHNLTLKSITKLEAVLGEDIILTPEKAKEQFHKVNYVRVSVSAKMNYDTNDGIAFTDTLEITTVETGNVNDKNVMAG